MKKGFIALLRVLGVCGLVAGLAYTLLFVENRESAYPAEVISIGTQDDADCTLILSGQTGVMIDTGESGDGEHILEVLDENKVEKIELLILTHPDKDHVGGASYLLDHIDVGTVVLPYFAESKTVYDELIQKMKDENISMLTLPRDRLFTVNDLNIRVFPPEDFHYNDTNNYSVATLVEHGQVRMFFAGDAKGARLEELAALNIGEVDLYKTAYHGRDTRMSTTIIEMLSPQYAIVNAAQAEEKTQEAFEKVGTQVFCSVPQDHIFTSDGVSLIENTK